MTNTPLLISVTVCAMFCIYNVCIAVTCSVRGYGTSSQWSCASSAVGTESEGDTGLVDEAGGSWEEAAFVV